MGKVTGRVVDLFEVLKKFDQKPGELDLDYMLRLKSGLETEEGKANKGPQKLANLYRVQLGFVLLAERPDADVLKWQRERAKALGYVGKGTRAIRELMAVAEAVEDAKVGPDQLARSVPIEVIQRPWARVRRALKVFTATGEVEGTLPRTQYSAQQKRNRAITALHKALERARKLVPEAELDAWLAAAMGKGTAITIEDAAAQYFKFLLDKHQGTSKTRAALRNVRLLVEHVIGGRPIRSLEQKDVDAFFMSDSACKRKDGKPFGTDTKRQIRGGVQGALTWWHLNAWIREIKVPKGK